MPEMRSHLCFAGLLLLGTTIYFSPIGALAKLVFQNETYSHITLIPLVSLFLLGIQRKNIFAAGSAGRHWGLRSASQGSFFMALQPCCAGTWTARLSRVQDVPNDYLSLCMAGAVAWVCGSFIAVYGTSRFQEGPFCTSVPDFHYPHFRCFSWMGLSSRCSYASAEASDIVFRLTGISYHRSGLVFEFPNVAVRGGRAVQRDPIEPVAVHPERHHGLSVFGHLVAQSHFYRSPSSRSRWSRTLSGS